MGFATPEEELQQFLDAQPPWLRKMLLLEPLSAEEKVAWVQSDWWWTLEGDTQIRNDYERLLRQVPGRWREYRKNAPPNPPYCPAAPSAAWPQRRFSNTGSFFKRWGKLFSYPARPGHIK